MYFVFLAVKLSNLFSLIKVARYRVNNDNNKDERRKNIGFPSWTERISILWLRWQA